LDAGVIARIGSAVLLGACCTLISVAAAPSASAVPLAPKVPTGISTPVSYGADLLSPVQSVYFHGSVWFADRGQNDAEFQNTGSIGKISSSGYVRNFPTNSLPTGLVLGPDHNLWFSTDGSEIGRISSSGKIKYFDLEFKVFDETIDHIVAGPGGLWFDGGSSSTQIAVPYLGRITTKGSVRIYKNAHILHPGVLAASKKAVYVLDDGGVDQASNIIGSSVLQLTPATNKLRRIPTKYYVDHGASAMTIGPDGAIWIADDHVLRVTTAGHWTKYGTGSLNARSSIIVGPDKRLWFDNGNSHVGAITTKGHLSSYHYGGAGPLAFAGKTTLWDGKSGMQKISISSKTHRTYSGAIDDVSAIVTGPDKALWFTNQGNDYIGRFVPGKGTLFYRSSSIHSPTGLVVGPDKGLWFTNTGSNTIGRIGSATHKITAYHGTRINKPWGIAVGPDKALWFTNNGNNSVGRITTKGVVTNYAGGAATSQPEGITTGPDGALWFASYANNAINRMDPKTHAVTSITGTRIGSPTAVVSAQGYVWATSGDDTLVRITPSTGGKAYRTLDVQGLDGLAADSAGRIWFAWVGGTATALPDYGGIGVRADSTKVLYRSPTGYASNDTVIARGPTSAMWTASGFYNVLSKVSPTY
jgi:virginiamycin B lyase